MRKPGGYLLISDDGRRREYDTFTCRHCNKISFVRPKEKPEDIGGLCRVCNGLVCSTCVGHACVTLEQRLEAMEASYHARRSYGI